MPYKPPTFQVVVKEHAPITSGPIDHAINSFLSSLGLLKKSDEKIKQIFLLFARNPHKKFTSKEIMNELGIKNKNTLFFHLNKLIGCEIVRITTKKPENSLRSVRAYKLNGSNLLEVVRRVRERVNEELGKLEITAKFLNSRMR